MKRKITRTQEDLDRSKAMLFGLKISAADWDRMRMAGWHEDHDTVQERTIPDDTMTLWGLDDSRVIPIETLWTSVLVRTRCG